MICLRRWIIFIGCIDSKINFASMLEKLNKMRTKWKQGKQDSPFSQTRGDHLLSPMSEAKSRVTSSKHPRILSPQSEQHHPRTQDDSLSFYFLCYRLFCAVFYIRFCDPLFASSRSPDEPTDCDLFFSWCRAEDSSKSCNKKRSLITLWPRLGTLQ